MVAAEDGAVADAEATDAAELFVAALVSAEALVADADDWDVPRDSPHPDSSNAVAPMAAAPVKLRNDLLVSITFILLGLNYTATSSYVWLPMPSCSA